MTDLSPLPYYRRPLHDLFSHLQIPSLPYPRPNCALQRTLQVNIPALSLHSLHSISSSTVRSYPTKPGTSSGQLPSTIAFAGIMPGCGLNSLTFLFASSTSAT